MTARVRLAPSPTGTLHIGTARTAIFNWLFARNSGGKFLIRIEDTDKERSKPEFTQNILEGLDWLGIKADEKPLIQSERISAHRLAIQTLLSKGFAYRCYATDEELNEMREEQKQLGMPPRYDNRHRNLSIAEEETFKSEGRSSVIRFKINDLEEIKWIDLIRGQMSWKGQDLGGDMVIARRAKSDEIGDPLYNLVVVIDDVHMGITHIIRGEDHLANTAKQILLYQALGLEVPEFAHTPLILNTEGKKLSKRDGVTSINEFKEMGYTSEAIANYMTLLGWSPPEGMEERFTMDQASKVFNFERINKAGAKFDWDKLNWLNAQILHEWSPGQILNSLKPLWANEGWAVPNEQWGNELAKLLGPSLTLLNDGIEQARPFFEEPVLETDGVNQLSIEGAQKALKALELHLEQNPWDGINQEEAKEILSSIAAISEVKKGVLMKSLRAALLGKMQGPDLLTTWGLLARIGKDRTRLRRCF